MVVGRWDEMEGGRETTDPSPAGRWACSSEDSGSQACHYAELLTGSVMPERDLPTMMCRADVSASFVPTVE